MTESAKYFQWSHSEDFLSSSLASSRLFIPLIEASHELATPTPDAASMPWYRKDRDAIIKEMCLSALYVSSSRLGDHFTHWLTDFGFRQCHGVGCLFVC
ncbi:Uncharacterized protein HZ326_1009 [Fusarium oxysporum f. sp. albedinis]|nr:Uncharacterized protein HZ326_1009 [Fusarium oxysporum f. sp. albedinis]